MNIIAERNQNTLTYTSDQDTILVKADRETRLGKFWLMLLAMLVNLRMRDVLN